MASVSSLDDGIIKIIILMSSLGIHWSAIKLSFRSPTIMTPPRLSSVFVGLQIHYDGKWIANFIICHMIIKWYYCTRDDGVEGIIISRFNWLFFEIMYSTRR